MDVRRIFGAALLAIAAAWALDSAPAPPADPSATPAKPLVDRKPKRPLRDVAPAELQEPVGEWQNWRVDGEFVRKWADTGTRPFAGVAQVGGTTSPDGAEEIQIDFPREFHLRNRGGSDKAGLCVFASNEHSAIWQHVWQVQGIFPYMFSRPGGGWPEKLDKVIAELCASKGAPIPEYVQMESADIEPIKLALKTGRLPCTTYNFSPTGRYRGRTFHMVNTVHLTEKWAAVLDNNFPGTIEWMDLDTYRRVYAYGARGWSVVFLAPGPPPPPRN